jgi:hypothetical protein
MRKIRLKTERLMIHAQWCVTHSFECVWLFYGITAHVMSDYWCSQAPVANTYVHLAARN